MLELLRVTRALKPLEMKGVSSYKLSVYNKTKWLGLQKDLTVLYC